MFELCPLNSCVFPTCNQSESSKKATEYSLLEPKSPTFDPSFDVC